MKVSVTWTCHTQSILENGNVPLWSRVVLFVLVFHFDSCYFWLFSHFLPLPPSPPSPHTPHLPGKSLKVKLVYFLSASVSEVCVVRSTRCRTHTHATAVFMANCLPLFFLTLASSVSSSPSLCASSSHKLTHTHTAVHVRGNNESCECTCNNTAGELLLLKPLRTHSPLSNHIDIPLMPPPTLSLSLSPCLSMSVSLLWHYSLGEERINEMLPTPLGVYLLSRVCLCVQMASCLHWCHFFKPLWLQSDISFDKVLNCLNDVTQTVCLCQ